MRFEIGLRPLFRPGRQMGSEDYFSHFILSSLTHLRFPTNGAGDVRDRYR